MHPPSPSRKHMHTRPAWRNFATAPCSAGPAPHHPLSHKHRAPDSAKVKSKMMYASTKDFFKSHLDGISGGCSREGRQGGQGRGELFSVRMAACVH